MGEAQQRRKCPACHQWIMRDDDQCPYCTNLVFESPTLHINDQMRFDLARRLTLARSTPPSGTIALYLAGRSSPIIIEDSQPITLGRHIPGHSAPTIDLMQYHAGIQGVSRIHAVIARTERGHTIKDLGSTNGTWVNDLWVAANESVYLCSGDQIRLARLNMIVYLPTELMPE